MRRFAAILAAVAVLLFLLAPETGAQDTGWTIERFHSDITIERDATLTITEAIDVDFGALEKHGIYREIPVRYAWPDNNRYERVYGLDVISVTNADGRAWPYTRERNGANARIRIGDPDRTISGRRATGSPIASRVP